MSDEYTIETVEQLKAQPLGQWIIEVWRDVGDDLVDAALALELFERGPIDPALALVRH